jgi:hypothetical protein
MSDVELTEAEAAALAKLNRRANEALGTVLIDNTSDPYDLPVGNKSTSSRVQTRTVAAAPGVKMPKDKDGVEVGPIKCPACGSTNADELPTPSSSMR